MQDDRNKGSNRDLRGGTTGPRTNGNRSNMRASGDGGGAMDYFKKPWVIAVLILLVAFIGYWWLAGGDRPEPDGTPLTNAPGSETTPPVGGAEPGALEPVAPGTQPAETPPAGLPGGTAPTEGATELTPEIIREIETLLSQLQFDPGPVDGIVDDQTHSAIRAYQQASGLPETGQPSQELLAELREVAAGTPPLAPGTAPSNEGETPPPEQTPPPAP